MTEQLKKEFDGVAGKTVVFTGKMTRSHEQLRAIAAEIGLTARFNVSGATDFVVTGREPGKNLIEAANRNLPILSEGDFFALVRQERAEKKALAAGLQ